MTAEEKLMAYVDGELSAEELASFQVALGEDRRLQDALASERLLRAKLSDVHRAALDEKVPDRLTQLLAPEQATVIPFSQLPLRHTRPFGGDGWWKNVTAIAASLVVGLFLGQAILQPSDDASDATSVVPDAQLAQALETQLASNQTPDDAIQIGATFIGSDGQPCRTYEAPNSAGLACRAEGEWQLRLVAPGARSPNTEYQQAGSASELVMRNAQEMLIEGPMTAEQEKQARDAGWLGATP